MINYSHKNSQNLYMIILKGTARLKGTVRTLISDIKLQQRA